MWRYIALAALLSLSLGQGLWNKSMGHVELDMNKYDHQEIQDLDNLSKNFYNKMCRDVGRKDGCYKWVDLKGV